MAVQPTPCPHTTLGNGNLRPETLGVARRERSPRTCQPDRRDRFSAHRLRKCRAISDHRKSRRFPRLRELEPMAIAHESALAWIVETRVDRAVDPVVQLLLHPFGQRVLGLNRIVDDDLVGGCRRRWRGDIRPDLQKKLFSGKTTSCARARAPWMTLRAKASFFRRVARNHGRQAAAPNRPIPRKILRAQPIHSRPCDQFFFRVRNKRRLRSKFGERHPSPSGKMLSVEIATS